MIIQFLETLAATCADRGLCWSIGTTRIAEHECRVWPRKKSNDPTWKGPVMIVEGQDFADAIRKMLDRIAARPDPSTPEAKP
jgi:hypothetical protein